MSSFLATALLTFRQPSFRSRSPDSKKRFTPSLRNPTIATLLYTHYRYTSSRHEWRRPLLPPPFAIEPLPHGRIGLLPPRRGAPPRRALHPLHHRAGAGVRRVAAGPGDLPAAGGGGAAWG